MDISVIILLFAEALLALAALYFSGLLKRPRDVAVSAALVAAAFVLRGLCFSHVTLDYVNFLSQWVEYFRANGGFAALGEPIGNYNVPYMYFLAAFSYLEINDLYLIKLLSVFFDIVLAWAAMSLTGLYTASRAKRLTAFFGVLFLPTVILNGAYWGQCDSIYAAFAMLGIYFALSERPAAGMACIAVSFAFKLQAVFIMPIFVVLLITGRVHIRHFFIFPAVYILLMLPAVAAGMPFMDTITLYFDQMGTVGSALNYNSPSIFAFSANVQDAALASKLGILAAFALMLLTFLLAGLRRSRASMWAVLGCALVMAIGIPYLLPHMHERYFFVADVLTLLFACAAPEYMALPVLAQFASLLGYHAYLRGYYFLPMSYGAIALAIALLMALFFTLLQLFPRQKR